LLSLEHEQKQEQKQALATMLDIKFAAQALSCFRLRNVRKALGPK